MCKEKKCSLAILKEEAIGPGPRCCFFGKYAFLHVRQKKKSNGIVFFSSSQCKSNDKRLCPNKKVRTYFSCIYTENEHCHNTRSFIATSWKTKSSIFFSNHRKQGKCVRVSGKKRQHNSRNDRSFFFFLSGVVFVFFFSVQ